MKKYVLSAGKALLGQAAVTAAAILLLAFLMLKLEWGQEELKRGIFGVYGAACLAGGILAGKAAAKRKFLAGLECGGIYFLLLCLGSLAAGNEGSWSSGQVWKTLAVCAGCGMLGGMGSGALGSKG